MKTLTKFAAVALLAVTASHSAMAQYNHVLSNDGNFRVAVDINDIQVNQHGIRFIDTAGIWSTVQRTGALVFDKVEQKHAVDCQARTLTRMQILFTLDNKFVHQVVEQNPGDKFKKPVTGHEPDFVQIACATPASRLRRI